MCDSATCTHHNHESDQPSNHTHASGYGHTHEKVYVCPMHPDVKQTEPGDCPDCGMRLIES